MSMNCCDARLRFTLVFLNSLLALGKGRTLWHFVCIKGVGDSGPDDESYACLLCLEESMYLLIRTECVKFSQRRGDLSDSIWPYGEMFEAELFPCEQQMQISEGKGYFAKFIRYIYTRLIVANVSVSK